ncbi:glutenin, low molecular weight subunit-like [Drosophila hydei]|uniref:Glutenin, low molecular weight subunit-like n=1 Tax=Drosophila hydei TaxID=7224 RepID=A0A6J1MI35_DROHY|nr:glutenin, low molecular weight subunit-like [Drosophila hydei]
MSDENDAPQTAREDQPPQTAREDQPPQTAREDQPPQTDREDQPPQTAREDQPPQTDREDQPPQTAREDQPPPTASEDQPSPQVSAPQVDKVDNPASRNQLNRRSGDSPPAADKSSSNQNQIRRNQPSNREREGKNPPKSYVVYGLQIVSAIAIFIVGCVITYDLTGFSL